MYTHPVMRAIGVSHTACKDEFRRILISQLECIYIYTSKYNISLNYNISAPMSGANENRSLCFDACIINPVEASAGHQMSKINLIIGHTKQPFLLA